MMNNCVMTRLGKCSYAETGCSDCKIVNDMQNLIERADKYRWHYFETENEMPNVGEDVLLMCARMNVETGGYAYICGRLYDRGWEIRDEDGYFTPISNEVYSVVAWKYIEH